MNRRPFLAVVSAAAVLAAMTGAAQASTGSVTAAEHSSRRACAVAPAGSAACFALVVTDANLNPLATKTWQGGYSPGQLSTAYGLGGLTGHATVAVVDAYANPNAAADLAVYRTQFNLGPATLRQVNQTGGSALPAGNTGWGQEEMLDLEMVSAICPSCSILYVGANSASFADLGTAVDTAVNLGATVVSNSYGASEFRREGTYAAAYNHPGVAITVSSGDSGYGAQVPAAFNTVTAVGGTSLTLKADGSRQSETAWSGAGSGCSSYVSKPSWQKDAACSRRTIADVAAVADPNTGVAVYDSYGSTGGANWYVFGGTSVAAPIVGAIYALSGQTAGVPAALAYKNSSSLFDVTSGTNGTCTSRRSTATAYLCTAGLGYDGPTGNGTPNGSPAPF